MSSADYQEILKQLSNAENEHALLFTEGGLLINEISFEAYLPWRQVVQEIDFHIEQAHLDGQTIMLSGVTSISEGQLALLGYRIVPIRAFLNQAVTTLQNKIMRAYHWLNWDSHSRFCGKCGSALRSQFDKLEKQCATCNMTLFPKASPAVMVLLHRKNELLLARSPHFQPGVYSAIAGFVEIGESAEEAARRETFEELGLKMGDLHYFASQTWPFPDSFMMAFTSTDPEGELIIDKMEIEDAKWFNVRNLPTLPTAVSISRRLIENTIKNILDK
jgi:NAD+ diphosphatase